jgi:hypothetical protein
MPHPDAVHKPLAECGLRLAETAKPATLPAMEPIYVTLAGQDLEDDLERLRRAVVLDEASGNTPLHVLAATATIHGNWRHLALLLVGQGVGVDTLNRMGQTALARAVARGNAELTQALLESGSNYLIVDLEGLSALERALEKPGSETCEVMTAWLRRKALNATAGQASHMRVAADQEEAESPL